MSDREEELTNSALLEGRIRFREFGTDQLWNHVFTDEVAFHSATKTHFRIAAM